MVKLYLLKEYLFFAYKGVWWGMVNMCSTCKTTLTLKLNSPGGIEPQPIKLEFTIYPAELWIYFGFVQSPTAHLDLLLKDLGQNY